jgi:alkylated DNA nucleotide flippase Atl1
MDNMTARQKLSGEDPPAVYTVEAAKAARFNAKTMLIPSPMQVRDAIAEIPYGQTRTALQVRKQLAEASGAEVTCPRAMTICWLLVAEAAEEDRAENVAEVTPWWRVTKDGKPNPKLPGGAERHRALLIEEGVRT